MITIHGKLRLRELRNEYHDTNLDEMLAYLLTYGSAEMHLDLLPDERDPYVSVVWLLGDKQYMNGALVLHDREWSVHT